VTSLADRLRELAERLPSGASVTLTRDGLLELAAVGGGRVEKTAPLGEFTVGELAVRFHRSPSTIRDWCEQGRFEGAFKLNGRDWRIPQAAVDALLDRQRRQSRTSPVDLSAWRVMRGTE
jgi:excisionase family DNA binding protein